MLSEGGSSYIFAYDHMGIIANGIDDIVYTMEKIT